MVQLQIEADKRGGVCNKTGIAQQSPALLEQFTAAGVLISFGDLKGG
jgi:hypothetical protein